MEKNKENSRFRNQYSAPLGDHENVHGKSPVVSGQSLTGAELFRRQSAGLPVGCAVRQFNQIDPYLEKFSVYDAISDFRLRHGMLTQEQVPKQDDVPAPASGSAPGSASGSAPGSAPGSQS